MELYINNFKVDLNERLPFPLTYKISDIKNLNERRGNNSKTITLPGTKGNLFLLYQAFSLSSTDSFRTTQSTFDFDPGRKVPARYYEDGILLFNGYCQLVESTLSNGEWSFEIILFSEQIDYMAKLKQVNINELDFNEYNHECTRDNQTDSWDGIIKINNTSTSNKSGSNWDGLGYYYGLIDYGFSRSNPRSFSVEQIIPQVFIYDILKRLFEIIGITWNSAFFESQRFKRLLLAYSGGEVESISQSTADYYTAINDETPGERLFVSYDQIESVSKVPFINEWISEYDNRIFSTYLKINNVSDPSGQMTGSSLFRFQALSNAIYQLNYTGEHDVSLDVIVSGANLIRANFKLKILLRIVKNGVWINSWKDVVYNISAQNFTGPTTANISFNFSKLIDMKINDEINYIDFAVRLDSAYVVTDAKPTKVVTEISVESIDAEINMIVSPQNFTPGENVILNQFLPDMDGLTFFKGITTAFNLYCKPSKSDPTILEIEPLTEFYGDPLEADQWSNIVDYSKSLKVTPTLNFASRYYNFKFTEDNDYYNSSYLKDVNNQYGSFVIDTQNEFSKENTDFTLPFAQKLLVNIPLNNVSYTNIIVPRSFQVRVNDDGSSQINISKGKPFIVQLGPMTSANWNHIDENGVSHSETSYPYVGHLNSLTSPTFDFNFGVPNYIYYDGASYTTENLYYYHEQFIKELISRYGKQLNCYVKITPEIINRLDFKKLINIDGVVYRLQSITNYDSGKDQTTEVELIRIIKNEGLVSFNPPAPVNNPIATALYRVTEEGTLEYARSNEEGTEIRIVE